MTYFLETNYFRMAQNFCDRKLWWIATNAILAHDVPFILATMQWINKFKFLKQHLSILIEQ